MGGGAWPFLVGGLPDKHSLSPDLREEMSRDLSKEVPLFKDTRLVRDYARIERDNA